MLFEGSIVYCHEQETGIVSRTFIFDIHPTLPTPEPWNVEQQSLNTGISFLQPR